MDFKNPRTGLSGINATAKRSNEKYNDIKIKLQNDEGYQLNKQIGGKPSYFPIWGRGQGSYQCDLMFLPAYKGTGIVLCCINVNTRYAYAYAMRNKTDTHDAMQKFITHSTEDKRICSFLQSDKGSEFNNAKMKELFKDNDIEYNFVNTGDHAGQGKVERFNQTLRRLVTLYTSSNNNNDWVKVLDDLIFNYNHRFNRKLECSPADANEDTEVVKQIAQYKLAQKAFLNFHIGDSVRILKNRDIFDKGRQQWSTVVFKIQDMKGHLFKVNDEYYKHYQLQKVTGSSSKDDFEVENKKDKDRKKIMRALRKEGIVGDGDQVEFSKRETRARKEDHSLNKRVKVTNDEFSDELATIVAYDPNGPYHWRIKYDNLPKGRKNKFEYIDKQELDKYLIK